MNKSWMIVAAMGLGIGLGGCAHHHHDEEESEEGNEVKMTLDQVPGPVRDTLMQQAGGATIKSVDKEDYKGKVVYETDVMNDGKNWEIRVAPDGRLLSKKIDNEEDEKPAKKEEKEDDEKK